MWYLNLLPYAGRKVERDIQRIKIDRNLTLGRIKADYKIPTNYLSRKHVQCEIFLPSDSFDNLSIISHAKVNTTYIDNSALTPGVKYNLVAGNKIGLGVVDLINDKCFIYRVSEEEDVAVVNISSDSEEEKSTIPEKIPSALEKNNTMEISKNNPYTPEEQNNTEEDNSAINKKPEETEQKIIKGRRENVFKNCTVKLKRLDSKTFKKYWAKRREKINILKSLHKKNPWFNPTIDESSDDEGEMPNASTSAINKKKLRRILSSDEDEEEIFPRVSQSKKQECNSQNKKEINMKKKDTKRKREIFSSSSSDDDDIVYLKSQSKNKHQKLDSENEATTSHPKQSHMKKKDRNRVIDTKRKREPENTESDSADDFYEQPHWSKSKQNVCTDTKHMNKSKKNQLSSKMQDMKYFSSSKTEAKSMKQTQENIKTKTIEDVNKHEVENSREVKNKKRNSIDDNAISTTNVAIKQEPYDDFDWGNDNDCIIVAEVSPKSAKTITSESIENDDELSFKSYDSQSQGSYGLEEASLGPPNELTADISEDVVDKDKSSKLIRSDNESSSEEEIIRKIIKEKQANKPRTTQMTEALPMRQRFKKSSCLSFEKSIDSLKQRCSGNKTYAPEIRQNNKETVREKLKNLYPKKPLDEESANKSEAEKNAKTFDNQSKKTCVAKITTKTRNIHLTNELISAVPSTSKQNVKKTVDSSRSVKPTESQTTKQTDIQLTEPISTMPPLAYTEESEKKDRRKSTEKLAVEEQNKLFKPDAVIRGDVPKKSQTTERTENKSYDLIRNEREQKTTKHSKTTKIVNADGKTTSQRKDSSDYERKGNDSKQKTAENSKTPSRMKVVNKPASQRRDSDTCLNQLNQKEIVSVSSKNQFDSRKVKRVEPTTVTSKHDKHQQHHDKQSESLRKPDKPHEKIVQPKNESKSVPTVEENHDEKTELPKSLDRKAIDKKPRKASVTFNEERNQIHFIDKEDLIAENPKRNFKISVKEWTKRADILDAPLETVMHEKIDSVILSVLNWSCNMFNDLEKCKKTVCPAIFRNDYLCNTSKEIKSTGLLYPVYDAKLSKQPTRANILSFTDYDSYKREWFPLLLSNLWYNLALSCEKINKVQNNGGIVEVKGNIIDFEKQTVMTSKNVAVHRSTNLKIKVEKITRLLKITCMPSVNDFIFLDVPAIGYGSRLHRSRVFGYVKNVSYLYSDNVSDSQSMVYNENDCHEVIGECELEVEISATRLKQINLNCSEVFIRKLSVAKRDIQSLKGLFILNAAPLLKPIVAPTSNLKRPKFIEETCAVPNIFKINPRLNPKQEKMSKYLVNTLKSPQPSISLLDGVPGSGKTELMLSVAAKYIVDSKLSKLSGKKQPDRVIICTSTIDQLNSLALRFKSILANSEMALRDYKVTNNFTRINMVCVAADRVLDVHVQPFGFQQLVKLEKQARKRSEDDDKKNNPDYDDQLEKNLFYAKILREQLEVDAFKEKKMNYHHLETNLRKHKDIYDKWEKHLIDGTEVEFSQDYKIESNLLRRTEIILTTIDILNSDTFTNTFNAGHNTQASIVIIDDAHRVQEISSLIPLTYGATKLLLVGDSKAPNVQLQNENANKLGYNASMFKRIITVLKAEVSQAEKFKELSYYYLPKPIRYGRGMCSFVKDYYPNIEMPIHDTERILNPLIILDCVDSVANNQSTDINLAWRVLDIISYELIHTYKQRPYKYNAMAVCTNDASLTHWESLLQTFSNQKKLDSSKRENNVIRFARRNTECELEASIILICLDGPEEKNSFAKDISKLYLAMTRASHCCVVIGNLSLYRKCSTFMKFIVNAKNNGVVHKIGKTSSHREIAQHLFVSKQNREGRTRNYMSDYDEDCATEDESSMLEKKNIMPVREEKNPEPSKPVTNIARNSIPLQPLNIASSSTELNHISIPENATRLTYMQGVNPSFQKLMNEMRPTEKTNQETQDDCVDMEISSPISEDNFSVPLNSSVAPNISSTAEPINMVLYPPYSLYIPIPPTLHQTNNFYYQHQKKKKNKNNPNNITIRTKKEM